MLVNRFATLNSVYFLLILRNAKRGLGRHTLFILRKQSIYNERSDWLKANNYIVILNGVNQTTVSKVATKVA